MGGGEGSKQEGLGQHLNPRVRDGATPNRAASLKLKDEILLYFLNVLNRS